MMVTGSSAVEVQTDLMTFDEFLKLVDPSEGHWELHHGRVVHVPPRKKLHLKIQQALLLSLRPLEAFGFLTGELPFRPAPEHESWQCDVGFISQARWDADDSEYFLGAPDLVIEVLSKSNTMDEVLDRQDVCLGNGCVSFWVVDPKRHIVMVTTLDRTTKTYGSDDVVPLSLIGSIEVAAIFR